MNTIWITIFLKGKEVTFSGVCMGEEKENFSWEYKPVKSTTNTYFFPFQGSWGQNREALRSESNTEP